MNDLTLPTTPEQNLAVEKVVHDLMELLSPIDQIQTLNRAETYRLFKMAMLVNSYVEVYVNTAHAHFRHLSKPKEDNKQEIMLRKIERALNNRGLNLADILGSLNE